MHKNQPKQADTEEEDDEDQVQFNNEDIAEPEEESSDGEFQDNRREEEESRDAGVGRDEPVPAESDEDFTVEILANEQDEVIEEEDRESEQKGGLSQVQKQQGRARSVKEVRVVEPVKPPPPPAEPTSRTAANDNGVEGNTSKQASSDAGMYVGVSSRVAAASCGPTVTNAAQAAALGNNSALAKVKKELTDLVLGETAVYKSSFNAETKDKLRNAGQNSPLIITIKHIDGDLAGQVVAGLQVIGALYQTNNTFSMTMQVSTNPENYQYNIAVYGTKLFEARCDNGTEEALVHTCNVTIKPSYKTRPRKQYVYHSAADAKPITARIGFIVFSSRHDYRSTDEAPVFADIRVPYEGGPVRLPPNLPDALISVHPELPGYSKANFDRFILAGGEIDPSELQVNLSLDNLATGEWRVVLNWAEQPRDLDLYCIRDKAPFKIYHGFKNAGGHKDEKRGMIQLDVDVHDGKGPETNTFTPEVGVRYRFGVKNFVWEGEPKPLSESEAQVKVFRGPEILAIFDVPTSIVARGSVHAKNWNVFELVNGSIVTKQEVSLDNIIE